MCVLVEGHCISDTVALHEMIATPAAKLSYDHQDVLRANTISVKQNLLPYNPETDYDRTQNRQLEPA